MHIDKNRNKADLMLNDEVFLIYGTFLCLNGGTFEVVRCFLQGIRSSNIDAQEGLVQAVPKFTN